MKLYLYFTLLALTLLSACGTFAVSVEQSAPTATSPSGTNAPTDFTPTVPLTGEPIEVVYIRDGNILVWDDATGQAKIIFASGDVTRVMFSDDGQVIAFLRRSIYEQPELWEQLALWAVDRDGKNPRELVSAEVVRQRLNVTLPDSSGIAEVEWIPNTHRLVYHTNRYYLPGQGAVYSPDVYIVDADTGSDTLLAQAVVPAEGYFNSMEIVPSPDGQQVALITGTNLNFINADGSDRRNAALTYPSAPCGDVGCVMPVGVWTQDSSAFVITGSFQEDPIVGMDFTIWRVPADGSGPEALASVAQSHPTSVTFSPDGNYFAFGQTNDPQEPFAWFVAPLTGGVGPLAIPYEISMDSYASLHWSPAGGVFTGNLMQLCPGATQDSEVCDTPTGFEGAVQMVQWIDSTRVLFLTREPAVLFFGRLGEAAMPIVAWPSNDYGSDFDVTLIPPP